LTGDFCDLTHCEALHEKHLKGVAPPEAMFAPPPAEIVGRIMTSPTVSVSFPLGKNNWGQDSRPLEFRQEAELSVQDFSAGCG